MNRFTYESACLEHRGQTEREDEAKLAVQPSTQLPDLLVAFNLTFNQRLDVNQERSALDLRNLSMHAAVNDEPHLALQLARHAEIAKESV